MRAGSLCFLTVEVTFIHIPGKTQQVDQRHEVMMKSQHRELTWVLWVLHVRHTA